MAYKKNLSLPFLNLKGDYQEAVAATKKSNPLMSFESVSNKLSY